MIWFSDMEKKQYSVNDLKKRLKRYRDKDREIDCQIERLERMISKMAGLGSPVITDMPRSPVSSIDRMSIMLSQKDELDAEIRRDSEEQSREWNEIEKILRKLKCAEERSVIRIRYHDGEGWNTVSEMMFGGRRDYLEKEGTYLRRVHKLHGSALLNMTALIEAESLNTETSAVMQ